MNDPILSILVITHNQRELLKHCLDSVLGQKLNVPFEIIVSDDRSEDGTAEFIAELQEKFSNGKLQIANLVDLVYTRCNSNDCDPKNVSERCGWNKLNVYNHARGKYFVNIDADDFLKSDDIYQAQLDMLSAHPECSMCLQDVWELEEGEPIENGVTILSRLGFKDHQIIPTDRLIDQYRIINQCFMMRRHPEVNCAELYGKYFDDSIITLHHLQFGSCVYLRRADYVWIRYKSSITMTLTNNDLFLENHLLPLHHARFIPTLAPLVMEQGLKLLVHMFKILAKNDYEMSVSNRMRITFEDTPGYVYRVLSKDKPDLFDKIKLRCIRMVLLCYNRYKWNNWHFLYTMMINRKEANRIFGK